MIDRYVVRLSMVGPEKLPIHVMTHRNRNTAKVTMPATIWFFVRLEMSRPTEMKQPPSRSSPRYAVAIGFHSGWP